MTPALKAWQWEQGRKRLFGQNTLVVTQVACSLLLLVAATQLYRSFTYALSDDPGFAGTISSC